jgi:hypothetical protein
MMHSFNTNSPAQSGGSSSGGGSNTLIWVAVGLGLAYVAYKYVIKPEIDRDKQQ